jgi:hypothetical protein
MTLQEALEIARTAQPLRRATFDKLQSADQIALGAAALAKTYDAMGGTVADMQKRLDQIRADLDHVENNPGAKRIIH